MISPIVLERPGRWRLPSVALLLLLGILPAVPLLWGNLTPSTFADLRHGIGSALANSLLVALLVTVLSLFMGLPLGVIAGLYSCPARRASLAAMALPMLVPSFLWAIGWSALAARLDGMRSVVAGTIGCTIVFLAAALPLVVLASLAAVGSLSLSQLEAARLSGGERTVLWHSGRAAAVPAAAAASLAGLLTLSDPGPGQILGLRTASAEILTSFSALYDYALAARQCAWLTLVVLVIGFPMAIFAAPRFGNQMLGRHLRGHRPLRSRKPWLVTMVLGLPVLLLIALPVLGLVLPLRDAGDLVRAWRDVRRTLLNTLLYAGGAGVIAAVGGWLLSAGVGRENRIRTGVLVWLFAIVALPPAAMALGVMRVAAQSPPSFDAVLRSRFTVMFALAARLFPVAAVLCLHTWQTMPASWSMAASIHGVPLPTYLRRVVVPRFFPVLVLASLLVALLASADVGTVLLLHPPGEASLPLAIFTVMANAPESLVASLCVSYLASAALMLWLMLWMVTRRD